MSLPHMPAVARAACTSLDPPPPHTHHNTSSSSDTLTHIHLTAQVTHHGARPCSADGGEASTSLKLLPSNALSTMPLMLEADPGCRLPSCSVAASTEMACNRGGGGRRRGKCGGNAACNKMEVVRKHCVRDTPRPPYHTPQLSPSNTRTRPHTLAAW